MVDQIGKTPTPFFCLFVVVAFVAQGCFPEFTWSQSETQTQQVDEADSIEKNHQEVPDWPESQNKWWRLKIRAGENQGSITRLGNIWIQAQDESMLFEDQIGRLHILAKDDVLEMTEISKPEKFSEEDLESRLKEILPEGFRIHSTDNYTFCYWTDLKYVKWVGGLYERMYRSFKNFWRKKGFKFEESERPKIVLIFKNQAQYSAFATAELQSNTNGMIGHYHLLNHWVVMFDLTASGQFGSRKKGISKVLAHPNAVPQVATIIHEATHQLMFHSEMQVRMSEIPLWVSEGLAMYFEAPDLKSRRGWTGIGKVNVLRVGPFRNYLARRPANSLRTLIEKDDRLRNTATIKDAYAEAWALNYFLLKKYPKSYSSYLKALSKRYPQVKDTPEERAELFEKHMGMSIEKIDQKMIKYLSGRR